MTDDFYEFEHECEQMPDGVRFCKMNGASTSQFDVSRYERGVVLQSTVL